jgi:hypothetical protein
LLLSCHQFCFLQTFLQAFYAAIIHKFIIQRRGTTAAYLIGYGVVIPTVLQIPYTVLDLFDLQNKTLKMSMVTLPTIVFFRVFEAMYGTSPHTVESSIGTYMAYYTSLCHFDWNPKTKTRRILTLKEFLSNFFRLLVHFHLVGLVLSVAMHFDYQPFSSNVILDDYHFSLDLFSPAHMANCYLLGLVTFLTLAVGFEMAAFGDNLKGFVTKPIFHNPLFTSRSPTEFWGRKWNMVIHKLLKHSVFLPARQFFPTPICVALTFLASGALHDYTWTVMFYHHNYLLNENGVCHIGNCYHPIVLKVTAFFAWNSVIMLLERRVGHLFGFTKSWPTIVVSQLVLLTALPVSHWFTGDWAVGGYFNEFAVGLWIIRKV